MEEETHDAEAQLVEPEPPLIPVEPVFACSDGRAAWDKRKRYLVKIITAFNKERLPDTGTTKLRRFLQDMTVPRKCISELIPEEFENLSEDGMQKIILRIQTLSNAAIDSKKDLNCMKKKSSSSSTCGDSLGQLSDSSAPEVEIDLGDSID